MPTSTWPASGSAVPEWTEIDVDEDTSDVTISGLDMNAHLGYEFMFSLAAGGTGAVTVRPSASATNGKTNRILYSGVSVSGSADTVLHVQDAGDTEMVGSFKIAGKTGQRKSYMVESDYENGASFVGFVGPGRYAATGNVTSIVIHATTIKAGSWFAYRPLKA